MSHAPTAPFPAASPKQKTAATPWVTGRQMILAGWVATMAGVGCYCRSAFSLPPEAEFLDTFTRAGTLGWAAAILLGGGVLLWLVGNLRHLWEAMAAPPVED